MLHRSACLDLLSTVAVAVAAIVSEFRLPVVKEHV